jgi:hypothetical protein
MEPEGSGYAEGGMGQAQSAISGSAPFSTLAIAAKAGIGGVGFDVATPLGRHANLRAGGTFFGYNLHLTEDGIPVTADILLRSGTVSLDYFPRGGGFHISPSLTAYNGNHVNGSATVPGNMSITLNNQDYTSDPSNPLHGAFSMVFGKRIAPGLTLGWGNMIPRTGRRWAVPFEVGFEYVGDPLVQLNLTGGACQQGGCQPVNSDPSFQANEELERQKLTSNVNALRFFPVVSIGVSYRY